MYSSTVVELGFSQLEKGPNFFGAVLISNSHSLITYFFLAMYLACKRTQSLQDVEGRRWWLPLRSLLRIGSEKVGRHPLHGPFATINVLTASVFAGTVRPDMIPALAT